jgi:hypothetical protein
MGPGQVVRVANVDGKLLKRKVVDVIGEVVLVCKEEEYEQARRDKRLPWCLGIRREYVQKVETTQ